MANSTSTEIIFPIEYVNVSDLKVNTYNYKLERKSYKYYSNLHSTGRQLSGKKNKITLCDYSLLALRQLDRKPEL